MRPDYMKKYIELLKNYHKLHAILSQYTIELQHSDCLGDIQHHLRNSADKIKEIDMRVREKVIKGNVFQDSQYCCRKVVSCKSKAT